MYKGNCEKGKASGYGEYIHADGATYEGSWYEDKQQGCTEVQKWIFIFRFKYLKYIFNIEKFTWFINRTLSLSCLTNRIE